MLVLTALSIKLSVIFLGAVGLQSKSLSGVLITGSLLCSSNHVAMIVTCTSSSILSSKLIHQIIFTSGSMISSITLAASCTSVGVRSVPPDTANIILFALSIFVSNSGFAIAFLAASTALFSHAPYPIPNNALPEFCITTFISAKSMFISPGFVIRSEIHLIQEYNILSIIKNACLNVVFLSITLKILSFGITINVSTALLIFINHSSAFTDLFLPSKLNGFVTTPIVSIHISFAIFAIIGPAQVPVHPHIQRVMKTISVSCSMFFMSDSLSSAAFLPISGFAQAHKPFVRFNPTLIFFGAKLPAKS